MKTYCYKILDNSGEYCFGGAFNFQINKFITTPVVAAKLAATDIYDRDELKSLSWPVIIRLYDDQKNDLGKFELHAIQNFEAYKIE